MACTQPCSCCKGACCYDDGGMVCAQHTCDDCEALPLGTWKGAGTVCADYDCTDGCCDDGECVDDVTTQPYTACEYGYNASACDGSSCTPSLKPSATHPSCEDGTILPSTVVVSGVTGTSGDPEWNAAIDACFSDDYAIARDCCSGASTSAIVPCTFLVEFDLGNGFNALVTFQSPGNRTVTVACRQGPSTLVSITRTETPVSTSAPCGDTVYDCDLTVSGAPTSTYEIFPGTANFASANITSS